MSEIQNPYLIDAIGKINYLASIFEAHQDEFDASMYLNDVWEIRNAFEDADDSASLKDLRDNLAEDIRSLKTYVAFCEGEYDFVSIIDSITEYFSLIASPNDEEQDILESVSTRVQPTCHDQCLHLFAPSEEDLDDTVIAFTHAMEYCMKRSELKLDALKCRDLTFEQEEERDYCALELGRVQEAVWLLEGDRCALRERLESKEYKRSLVDTLIPYMGRADVLIAYAAFQKKMWGVYQLGWELYRRILKKF